MIGQSLQSFVLARLAFFFSGHSMQFGGLQVSFGLTGMDSFSFVRSGLLLFINTFGHHILLFIVSASQIQVSSITFCWCIQP